MGSSDWTFAVLPDTQIYAASHPEIFEAQTRWIAERHAEEPIVFVLHEGDITNDASPAQWEVARRAFAHLDGVVPYVLATGNHDHGPGGSSASRDTPLNDVFPLDRFDRWPSFLETFEPGRVENSVHRFETPTGPWLVVALEFGPRDAVVTWARSMLEAHRGAPAILLTHAYLYSDHTRYDRPRRPDQKWSPHEYGIARLDGGVNDGEALFDKLVRPHDDLRLVLSGHVLNEGVARRTDRRAGGAVVHQLLANYQTAREGGAGFLRLMRLVDGGRRLLVRTYSPVHDEYRSDPQNELELDLTPA